MTKRGVTGKGMRKDKEKIKRKNNIFLEDSSSSDRVQQAERANCPEESRSEVWKGYF